MAVLRMVDGGYFSWCYGPDEVRWGSWSPHIYEKSHLMIMDYPTILMRQIYDPDYKSDRLERRNDDPVKRERYELVGRFKRIIWEEPSVRKVFYPGLEADDIIALYCWLYPGSSVIGIDKDLLQLTNQLSIFDLAGNSIHLAKLYSRLPKSLLSDIIWRPELIPIYLSIMGDKSDSIRRLVPPHRLDIAKKVLKAEEIKEVYHIALEEFGTPFLHNLMISVLPYPLVFGIDDPLTLFDLLSRGLYRSQELLGMLDPYIYLTLLSRGEIK